jgi:hypothetical protein
LEALFFQKSNWFRNEEKAPCKVFFASKPTDISILLKRCLQGPVLGSKMGFFLLYQNTLKK